MSFDQLMRFISMNLRYTGKPPWDTGQSPPELLDFIQSHPAGKALDLGCGTGTNCLTLAKAGWQTTGVDIAWLAINKAHKRFKQNNLTGEFHRSDILLVSESDAVFDLVLDIGCYHSLPVQSRLIYQANVYRWLQPGGYYLIYAHRTSKGRPDPTYLTEGDVEQFQEGLNLINRKECEDRWGRKTVWLWFTKPAR